MIPVWPACGWDVRTGAASGAEAGRWRHGASGPSLLAEKKARVERGVLPWR